jgi:hypothetical protein
MCAESQCGAHVPPSAKRVFAKASASMTITFLNNSDKDFYLRHGRPDAFLGR